MIILMGMAGLAVYIQTKTLFSYTNHAIPPPEALERIANASGSVVIKNDSNDEIKKPSECSECTKKPQPPEWMKEDD